MNLQDDDFTLLGLPQRFEQDAATLSARWKALQAQIHPDNFAAQDAAAQRRAMQWSVRVNEAYQRLKDPLLRAAYLCELQGAPINAEKNTAMPAAFLMQQMQWHEALEEASTGQALDTLADEIAASEQALRRQCAQLLDQDHNPQSAAEHVRAWMFTRRLNEQVMDKREKVNG